MNSRTLTALYSVLLMLAMIFASKAGYCSECIDYIIVGAHSSVAGQSYLDDMIETRVRDVLIGRGVHHSILDRFPTRSSGRSLSINIGVSNTLQRGSLVSAVVTVSTVIGCGEGVACPPVHHGPIFIENAEDGPRLADLISLSVASTIIEYLTIQVIVPCGK